MERSQKSVSEHPWPVFGYFTLLILIANCVTPSGSLAQLPIQFFLKDHLNLTAAQSAMFSLVISVPLYGAFLFGLIRDRWSPFGLGDRGFFRLFAPIAALGYVGLSIWHSTYYELLLGIITVMLVYRLIGPAIAGMTATMGQRLSMTGRLSSLIQVVGNAVAALIAFLSGKLPLYLSYQGIFLCLAAASLIMFAASFLNPAGMFHPRERADRGRFFKEIGHLFGYRPLWPALAIWLIWAFGPGQATPLFYQQTNVIHMNSDQIGQYNAIGAAAFVPGALLYGLLCRFVKPKTLLIIATCFAIPQMLALNYITTVTSAYIASGFIGSVGGMAATAFYDLLLRSCPPGFEATALELGITLAVLVDRLGNLIGSNIYERPGGFALCNWMTAAAYALILPTIFLVPANVLRRRDAET